MLVAKLRLTHRSDCRAHGCPAWPADFVHSLPAWCLSLPLTQRKLQGWVSRSRTAQLSCFIQVTLLLSSRPVLIPSRALSSCFPLLQDRLHPLLFPPALHQPPSCLPAPKTTSVLSLKQIQSPGLHFFCFLSFYKNNISAEMVTIVFLASILTPLQSGFGFHFGELSPSFSLSFFVSGELNQNSSGPSESWRSSCS